MFLSPSQGENLAVVSSDKLMYVYMRPGDNGCTLYRVQNYMLLCCLIVDACIVAVIGGIPYGDVPVLSKCLSLCL